MAWEQFELAAKKAQPQPAAEADLPLDVTEDGDKVIVQGRDFTATFDSKVGAMSGYMWRGAELLAAPVQPDFWRAPLDNDRGARLPRRLRAWRDAGQSFKVEKAEVKKPEANRDGAQPAEACIQYVGKLTDVGDADYSVTYTVDATGLVTVEIDYKPQDREDAPMLPRFGTEWILDGSLNQITWYGRGPTPTYSDRKQAPVGIYSGSVADQFVHYFRPQESSNKVDVRWVAVTNPSGIGLLATGGPLLSVGVSEFNKAQMERARYDFQLERRNRTYLNLDLLQMGVGGNDSWGATAMDPYLPSNKPYHYKFTIRGIDQPPM